MNASLTDSYDTAGLDLFDKARALNHLAAQQNETRHLLYRRISTSGSAAEMNVIDPRSGEPRAMINFASNDYLNLTRHPRVIAAGRAALEKYGAGAGSVPLLGGTLDIHVELEQRIAAFKGCESAILYTSGFASNAGSLLAMLNERDCAILDLYVHASILDGCRQTNVQHFRHNDMRALERVLAHTDGKYRTRLVIVDGVYSMDGDIALLDQIVERAHAHGAYVMVDEAHATGVIGANGRGTPEHFGVEGQVDIVAGTFSKALGGVGGFVATTADLVRVLHLSSRAYIFSTAPTPQVSGSLIEALKVIEEEPQLRERLWDNIRYFKHGLTRLGFDLGAAETAIFPIIVGKDATVVDICDQLHQHGIYANPVLYPAVPKKLARVRISLMADHSRAQLDYALNVLESLGRQHGLIA